MLSQSTVALLPAHHGISVTPLARALRTSLERLGRAQCIEAPPAGLLPPSVTGLRAQLASAGGAERSRHARFLLVECGHAFGAWERAAVAAADHVVIVAEAGGDPTPSVIERELLRASTGSGTLVLVHPPGTTLPRGTGRWLEAREGAQHRHVRTEVAPDGARLLASDVDRLARRLADAEIALVLGAGGARGVAHIGVLAALGEAGVPVDQVGGTSIGALVGGAYAMGHSPAALVEIGHRLRAARPFSDWTLPATSLLRGRRLEHQVRGVFGASAIEDLWLPFFCNSCDIARFRDVIHDRGELAEAALASSALPAMFPPRVHQGALLVDGGTSDMLPIATMRARSRGTLIAVDVSHERDIDPSHKRMCGPWSAAWRRLTGRGHEVLTMSEVFWRAAGFDRSRRIKALAEDADCFLRPPVEQFHTRDLRSMDEIVRIGHDHARRQLATRTWLPPKAISDPPAEHLDSAPRRALVARR